jgi:hypothetical protein
MLCALERAGMAFRYLFAQRFPQMDQQCMIFVEQFLIVGQMIHEQFLDFSVGSYL